MQRTADNDKDWLQSAIEEKHINVFDFEKDFGDPKFIAQGGFSKMYKVTGSRTAKKYALKYLLVQLTTVETDPVGYADFVQELKLLAQIENEDFVAKYYGILQDPETSSYIMVMRYAEQGSLHDYLLNNAGNLSWRKKQTLAYQIAEALDYIHEKQIVHRDLHSGNVLIDENGRAILADFGLSRLINSKTAKLSVQRRLQWIPPERLTRPSALAKHDTRGDIYSLGVIFWEISADGATPFPEADFLIVVNILQGARESPIEGTPKEYVALYTKCWDGDPEKRPTLPSILETLDWILSPTDDGNSSVKSVDTASIMSVRSVRTASIMSFKQDLDIDFFIAVAGKRIGKNLAKVLNRTATQSKLDLSERRMGDKGARALAEALKKNTNLTRLVLKGNNIGDEGAYYIAEGLKLNVTLTDLNLRYNIIGDKGCGYLAGFLKYNTVLTALNLEWNKIGAEGASVLAEALKENASLTDLNLEGNKISVKGAQAIAEALKQNTTLTKLNLYHNLIGADGARALAQSLKQNATLSELNLEWNNLGDEGICALVESLKQNITLIKLNLINNNIGSKGSHALVRILDQNWVLVRRDFKF